MLFKYLNPHVATIATETNGREKCQFEMCMRTDTQHSSMYVLISFFSITYLYIIDIVSGHFVSHIYHRQYILAPSIGNVIFWCLCFLFHIYCGDMCICMHACVCVRVCVCVATFMHVYSCTYKYA